jgi:hypothetical protein
LLKAYWFARQYEKSHNCSTVAVRRTLPVAPAPPVLPRNTAPRNNPNHNGGPREIQFRMKEYLINVGTALNNMYLGTTVPT